MRLFILGATGGIGHCLLEQALGRGHEITAFVRSPQKIDIHDEHLNVVKGDLFDADQMARALSGHDAVLSAFGPATLKKTHQREEFGKALCAALRQSHVQNVQMVSSAFLFTDAPLAAKILRSTVFKNLVPDMVQMEKQIAKDEFNWTIIRPPKLINRPQSHKYRTEDGRLPAGGFVAARSDVADFMISQAEKPQHIRQIVGLSTN